MPFTEDIGAFFGEGDFATCACWIPAGGRAEDIAIIFDAEFQAVNGYEVDIDATAPQALVASDDVPNIAQGDALTVNSTDYTITRVEPDGTGTTRLVLEEA